MNSLKDNQKNIYFRVDFGGLIGRGHLSRCLSLAEVFKNNGHEPIFISRKRPCNSNEKIPYKIFWLNEAPDVTSTDVDSWKVGSMEDEADEILKLVNEKAFIILDHYALKRPWQKLLRDLGHYIILFQDFYNEEFEVDVLINYNLVAKELYSPEFIAKKKSLFLLGPQYAPLNLRYSQEHFLRFSPLNDVLKIGLYLGGVESKVLEKVAIAISQIAYFQTKKLEWVVNSINEKKFLESIFSPKNLTVHVRMESLIPLYQSVQLFIGACGVSFLERACMGLWQINFLVAENQKEIALGAGKVFDIQNGNEEQLINFLMSSTDEGPGESNTINIKRYFDNITGKGVESIYRDVSINYMRNKE